MWYWRTLGECGDLIKDLQMQFKFIFGHEPNMGRANHIWMIGNCHVPRDRFAIKHIKGGHPGGPHLAFNNAPYDQSRVDVFTKTRPDASVPDPWRNHAFGRGF